MKVLFFILCLVNISLLKVNITCSISDKSDIHKLSKFVTQIKVGMKNSRRKIKVKKFNRAFNENQKSNDMSEYINDCFALTSEQAEDLTPILKIGTISGLEKIKAIIDDSSISDGKGELNDLISMASDIAARNKGGVGMEWYCKNVVLLAENDKYSQTITNYCRFIVNFKH